jgi:3-methyladenine DNA glycosylase Tag
MVIQLSLRAFENEQFEPGQLLTRFYMAYHDREWGTPLHDDRIDELPNIGVESHACPKFQTGRGDIPSSSKESDAMSKDLRKRGFKFVGTTICYAFMQATGMVNDHIVDCFRYAELASLQLER